MINKLCISDAGVFTVKAKNAVGEAISSSQLIVLSPPKFVKELTLASKAPSRSEVLTLMEKTQLKLDCQITGVPKPNLTWFKDDQELQFDDRIKGETKQIDHSLIIKSLVSNDEGLFEARCENSCGSASSKVFVEVNSLPVFVQKIADSELTVGKDQKHEFVCLYQGRPKPEITWYFNENSINELDDTYLISSEEIDQETKVFKSVLAINKIDLKMAGQYRCKLKNSSGEISQVTTLTVLKLFNFISKLPERLEIVEGKEIKLNCQIGDDCIPVPIGTWLKDRNSITASKRITTSKPLIDKENSSIAYSLSITDATQLDSGTYTLKLASKSETFESACQVEIISAPKIIKDIKQSIECNENQNILLEVHAIGKPQPKFKWYQLSALDGTQKEISEDTENITILLNDSKIYSLHFKSISKSDEGSYILKLSNNAGEIETKATIKINSKLNIINF